MTKTFTAAQLSKLRGEWESIDRVHPDRLADFRRIFDGCADAAIVQLTKANIKFVSMLAVTEKFRRGL
jgi:hypothetical protein